MGTTHQFGTFAEETTATTGTGTLVTSGATSGNRTLIDAVGSGARVRYAIDAANGGWELGEGVVTSGAITRATVFESSAGVGVPLSLPVGTHKVRIAWSGRDCQEAYPRLVEIGDGATLAGGSLTINCMRSANVTARVSLSQEVTSIAVTNVPTCCKLMVVVTQSGGPWSMPQSAWPVGTVFDTAYNLYSDSSKSVFWLHTEDGGTSWRAECNGPAAYGITDGAILSSGLTMPYGGLRVLDSDGTNALVISPGSNLTGNRTFTVTTGNNDRTLDISVADITFGATGATVAAAATAAAGRSALGLGSASTSAATAFASSTHATTHGPGGSDAIKLDDLAAPDDNTDLNASTSTHGLLRKLSGVAGQYLDGTGNFSSPSFATGGSGSLEIGVKPLVSGTLTEVTIDPTFIEFAVSALA